LAYEWGTITLVSYPLLSLAQQQNLPALIKATPLPTLFEDSTHQLWQCETIDGEMILKICDTQHIQHSSFWQGMSLLFDVQLPAQLGEFNLVYDLIRQHSPLRIPEYIASDSDNRNKQQRSFILTKMIAGKMIEGKDIDDEMVRSLATHISELHAKKQSQWGKGIHAEFELDMWQERFKNCLTTLAAAARVTEPCLAEALMQAEAMTPDYAVPIMPDLRWDQFLQQDGRLSALVDLDAVVHAPRELELVLLEYLLTAQQATVFKQYYEKTHTLPDLSAVRIAYRLLLFLMNVLGSQDCKQWMAAPYRWQP
jgi:hypothetical protein